MVSAAGPPGPAAPYEATKDLPTVPWCDTCDKFWTQPTMGEHGECPSCGTVIATPPKGVPWHFKVMLVGLAGYLIYRAYWFAEWLPKHI